MIDEKKLIEDIDNQVPNLTNSQINKIAEIIDRQPKVRCSDCSRRLWYQKGYQDGLNINKWIPCSERLPEEDGTYLAWITYEGREYTSMEEFDVITKWDFHTFNSNDKVIAWMPLPEDYKGE